MKGHQRFCQILILDSHSCPPLIAKNIYGSFLLSSQIFHYDHPSAEILHKNFSRRLEWHGTPDRDVQTASIYIHNITYNDIGTYRCTIQRTLHLPRDDEHVTVEKQVELNVVAEGQCGYLY